MKKFKQKIIQVLVSIRIKRISKIYNKKINRIVDIKNAQDPSLVLAHKQKWKIIYKKPLNLNWLSWYSSISGIKSPNFVPESVYYSTIEPILNNHKHSISYSDKNVYDLIFPEGLFPEVILRNIDGCLFSKNYEAIIDDSEENLRQYFLNESKIIIKPAVDSGGGQNILLFHVINGQLINNKNEMVSFQEIKNQFTSNYIFQRVIKQHPFLKQFNESSLNTIRVLTYRSIKRNRVKILHTILRVGAPGQFVDNSRAGGFSIGINSTGSLSRFAVRKDGKKYNLVNNVNLSNDYKVPFFEELKKTAFFVASKNIHHRLLGLDLTIDDQNKVRCIEVNNTGNEINFYQLNNGPLFGEFTDEVVEYCSSKKYVLFGSYEI